MPTDDITVETPPAGNESTETPPGDIVPQGLTAEQIVATINEAAASQNQEVVGMVRELQGIIQQQAKAAPAAPPDPNEFAEQLLSDGKATIRSEMNDWARSELAPVLGRSLEVDRDERIERAGVKVDEKFGPGFFAEQIQPRLVGEQGNLAVYPINQQGDPTVIRGAISAIIGNMISDDELGPTVREAMDKTDKAKRERDVATPYNMMGPGRPRTERTNVLSPEMKEALGKFQDVGVKVTEADLKVAMTREPTLSAWTKETT